MRRSVPELRPIIEIYEDTAEFWKNQRLRSSFSEKKYMDWASSHLQYNSQILDLGCGSGYPIADYFIKNKMQVTGVDGAQAMIEIAQKDYPLAQWKVADMRTLNLQKKFDAIISWDSFFHLNFEEQAQMFPIFKNHLNVHGLLIFTSGPQRGEAIGDMNGHALYHSSLDENEYRELLLQNGFEVVSYDPENKDCGGHTVWCCKKIG